MLNQSGGNVMEQRQSVRPAALAAEANEARRDYVRPSLAKGPALTQVAASKVSVA